MSNPTNKLTDKEIRSAKPVKMFDGEGLFLLVQAGEEKGSKRWRFSQGVVIAVTLAAHRGLHTRLGQAL